MTTSPDQLGNEDTQAPSDLAQEVSVPFEDDSPQWVDGRSTTTPKPLEEEKGDSEKEEQTKGGMKKQHQQKPNRQHEKQHQQDQQQDRLHHKRLQKKDATMDYFEPEEVINNITDPLVTSPATARGVTRACSRQTGAIVYRHYDGGKNPFQPCPDNLGYTPQPPQLKQFTEAQRIVDRGKSESHAMRSNSPSEANRPSRILHDARTRTRLLALRRNKDKLKQGRLHRNYVPNDRLYTSPAKHKYGIESGGMTMRHGPLDLPLTQSTTMAGGATLNQLIALTARQQQTGEGGEGDDGKTAKTSRRDRDVQDGGSTGSPESQPLSRKGTGGIAAGSSALGMSLSNNNTATFAEQSLLSSTMAQQLLQQQQLVHQHGSFDPVHHPHALRGGQAFRFAANVRGHHQNMWEHLDSLTPNLMRQLHTEYQVLEQQGGFLEALGGPPVFLGDMPVDGQLVANCLDIDFRTDFIKMVQMLYAWVAPEEVVKVFKEYEALERERIAREDRKQQHMLQRQIHRQQQQQQPHSKAKDGATTNSNAMSRRQSLQHFNRSSSSHQQQQQQQLQNMTVVVSPRYNFSTMRDIQRAFDAIVNQFNTKPRFAKRTKELGVSETEFANFCLQTLGRQQQQDAQEKTPLLSSKTKGGRASVAGGGGGGVGVGMLPNEEELRRLFRTVAVESESDEGLVITIDEFAMLTKLDAFSGFHRI